MGSSTKDQLLALSSDGVNLTTQELLHYQRYNRLLSLSPSRNIRAHLSGGYVSNIKGRGMEFDEARHYQPGDDIRAIDWRVTARTGKTHTKVYREERERPVFILCDFSSSMHFGTQLLYKSVQAAHIASLIAWNAIERGDKIGALIFTSDEHLEIKPKSRKRGVLTLSHGLTTLHEKAVKSQKPSTGAFEQSLMRLRRVARPGSLVCLISDFDSVNQDCTNHLSELRRHCELHAYHVFDPIEMALPNRASGRTLNIRQANTGQSLTFSSASARHEYATRRKQQHQQRRILLSPHTDKFLSINAGTPLSQQFSEPMEARRG